MNQQVTPTISLNETISTMGYDDPQNLSVNKARELINQSIQPTCTIEHLPIQQALGRVLAEDIVSGMNVPAHDNSAMDGYAFSGNTLSTVEEVSYRIIGKAFAGRAYQGTVAAGECVRIMTGAVMPDGCDTVVPLEFISKASEDSIHVAPGCIQPGSNRRMAGEDLAIGKIALRRGKVLRPADLGLLASLGIATVPVQRRLRVAFFSTGDELRSVDQPLDEGCIYDSNRYTLHAMLTRLGCELIDMGVVKDDTVTLEASFRQACEHADVVITTGGVSLGDADYIRQTMAQLGEVAFWSIAMRPGRPMAFGKINSNGKGAYLFGLPGNPVAVMVSFYFFVKQALLQMQGAEHAPPLMLKASSKHAIKKRAGRTEYQRGIAEINAAGELEVSITGSQGSGILRSMSEANCMIVLDHDQEHVTAGAKVMIVLFEGLI
ncbi:molybdopterin molybdenumtransferase MoeA [Undibacterium jejuense]|uniref:Molybdopterin molybdenumtransferase n=1 Tax=Undibacterium jejuense TaxID=1344949 RepID=A0A923HLS1_9BURK|nr:gephyrin-like molybdotransferase Glp [Undibacterium jejuense]MBC3863224.1 molybdopterin molybdenumtransferase MoeA [Undibacterium jejuense]